MPTVGVRVLAVFLLGASLLGCTSRSCTLVGVAPCCVIVAFDVRQVLATVPGGDAVVWACVDLNCVRHFEGAYSLGSPDRGTFLVTPAEVDDPEVDVRVVVGDHGRVVFDTTGQLQLHESRPNGPGCTPAVFTGDALATPEGDLIQQ